MRTLSRRVQHTSASPCQGEAIKSAAPALVMQRFLMWNCDLPREDRHAQEQKHQRSPDSDAGCACANRSNTVRQDTEYEKDVEHYHRIADSIAFTTVPSFVELLAALRAVEMVHTGLGQDFWRHHARVYGHAIVCFVSGSPMGKASAVLAAVKFNHLATPHIYVGRIVRYVHIFRRIVGPECAVAAA